MEELQSRSENRHNQIRKHLEDANYKEEYSSLTNLEQRESKHNAAVGMFVDKTNKDIETAINGVSPFLYRCEEGGSKQSSCYSPIGIIEYFLRDLLKFNLILDIDDDGWLRSTNGIEIAKGDGETLEKIKTSITQIRRIITNEVRSLLEDRANIVSLYNDDFLPKMRNLMTSMEDNHHVDGGCGLRYCKSKR
jgi:hypothetical protein